MALIKVNRAITVSNVSNTDTDEIEFYRESHSRVRVRMCVCVYVRTRENLGEPRTVSDGKIVIYD